MAIQSTKLKEIQQDLSRTHSNLANNSNTIELMQDWSADELIKHGRSHTP